jgi:hypothetical protein
MNFDPMWSVNANSDVLWVVYSCYLPTKKLIRGAKKKVLENCGASAHDHRHLCVMAGYCPCIPFHAEEDVCQRSKGDDETGKTNQYSSSSFQVLTTTPAEN